MAFAAATRAALASRDTATCRAALARYTGDYLPDEPYADWATAAQDDMRVVGEAGDGVAALAGLATTRADGRSMERRAYPGVVSAEEGAFGASYRTPALRSLSSISQA
jgi:hypothetical protein